jgi:hypothetical protein
LVGGDRQYERCAADQPGLLPSVRGASIESLSVTSAQDQALVAFADCEVDRAGGARHEGDDGGLVALADNPQGSMTAFERQVLDVGRACFENA